ncbi:alpha-L-rhamnosidase [Actinomyces glycerinitolerans]|uniref:alpha-L-rhamnosidase n=1 Tax=Actinomyces glycerinitolerans TaxID=1892869 RepID=A0A1M4RYM8_9ACTO|nr:alpha-L-rhamnosidase [Actinomyces glycerinitolerans]SHE25031.1 bacterial alpha-l-rhamnosidase [Actinomyces glycerinitolerans]
MQITQTGPAPAPVNLTVDHQHAPLGVAVPRPVLSWQVPGEAPASAYELQVRGLDPATGAVIEPPVWATGRVEIPEPPASPWLPYGGEPLASDADYTWRVRVWTGSATDAEPSPWAEAAFSTSLLDGADVVADWVEPSQTPVELEPEATFATLFTPQEPVPAGDKLHPVKLVRQDLPRVGADAAPITRARLYLSAQGVIEASIDGAAVGDSVLAPGWTSYHTYTEFEVHDVTAALTDPAGTPRSHTLGLRLGDGWFAGRATITGESGQYGTLLRGWWQLSITRADGTHQTWGPDRTARCTESGPLRYSDIMIGEKRDDRMAAAVAGWDRPGFDDSGWDPVRIIPTAELDPATALEPFRGEPVRRLLELPAARVITTPAGETVLDFGQVIAGRVRLRAVGPAGTEITLEHSEHLDADGNFFSNVQGPNKDQRDLWVLAGTGTPQAPETYEPTFTFHGFRYARVTGYPGELRTGDAVAVVVGSDLEAAGDFTCSDERLNRLHANTVWSQRANFLSIPTDCPQRERVGWTGDIQVFAPAATNNAQVHTFLARWLRNVRADQLDDGRVVIISPFAPRQAAMEGQPGIGGITAAAGWGDAIIRVPLTLWERYGDVDTLRANYPAMRAWVEMQSRQAATELPPRLRGADWEDTDRTSGWEALDEATTARQRLLWNSRMHFGDWLAPSTLTSGAPDAIMAAPHLTSEFVGAAFHAEALRTLAQVAQVLGHSDDAAAYRERWEAVRAAVAAEYIGADGAMAPDLQGMYVLALAFDIVGADDPDGGVRRRAVADRLVRLVHEAGDHLDTGFLSVPFLLDVLVDSGHADAAWAVLMQDTVPSWLYEVAEGATTIWESWDAVAPDGTVGAMSFNHYAFGCVDDWLFRRLGGIVPTEPGYRRVRVAPLTGGPVSWARSHRDTPFGRVEVAWERVDRAAPDANSAEAAADATAAGLATPGSTVRYEVVLPSGVTGELVTPDGDVRELSSGRTVLVA